MNSDTEFEVNETVFEDILKKYNFRAIYGDGVFGFYPDETSYHFCIIGSFTFKLRPLRLKIRIFDEIKIKHDRIVGCSDKSTLCKNMEDVEKCLQNISAQRKKLLVYFKIKSINKDFKKGE